MELIPERFLDILVVQLLAVIPFAWLVGRNISPRLRPLLAVVSLGACLLSLGGSALWMAQLSEDNLWPSVIQQLAVMIPFVLGLILLAQPLLRSVAPSAFTDSPVVNSSRMVWGCALILALVPPGVYRMSRIQSASEQLEQFQSQLRIGEFVSLSRDLLKIAPVMTYQERPLSQVIRDWEQQQQQITDLLPQVHETEQQVRMLAMLGLRDEALHLLDLERSPESISPEKCLLAATIYEHAQEWTQSCFWYEQARSRLSTRHSNSTPMLAAAYRGIGFCHRKQGNYALAEAAYLNLLEIEPTAETHFLLAQFYQDTQVGERSSHHLDQAAQLDSGRYHELAKEMQARLQSHQFSCFRLW